MKKVLSIILMGMFFISFAYAFEKEIVIRNEPGSFTGATLKIKASGTEFFGDQIYASSYDQVSLGIIRFDIETSATQFDVKVRLTNEGDIILMEELGPFNVSQEEIIIDFREKEEPLFEELPVEEKVIEEVIVNESSDLEIEVQEEEESSDSNENIASPVMGILGRVTSEVGGEKKPYYFGGLGVLFVGLLLFFVVKRAYRSGAKAELKNLAKIKLDEKIDALDDESQ